MDKILYQSISETRKSELSERTNHRPRHFFFRLSRFLSTVTTQSLGFMTVMTVFWTASYKDRLMLLKEFFWISNFRTGNFLKYNFSAPQDTVILRPLHWYSASPCLIRPMILNRPHTTRKNQGKVKSVSRSFHA